MDGGVRSLTNADLVGGAERALIVRLFPAGPSDGPYANRPERLVEELVGVPEVLVVEPDDLPAGWLMDPGLVGPAYTSGYWQGKDGAEAVLAFWRA